MSSIYNQLQKAAKLDLESVKTLTDKELFAPAIYHCEQVVEKTFKSIAGYYLIHFQKENPMTVGDKLKRTYGHKLLESTRSYLNTLLEVYIQNEIKQKPHITAQATKLAYIDLENVVKQIQNDDLVKDKIVIDFPGLIGRFYENIYVKITNSIDANPQIILLRESFKNPDNQYIKSIGLIHMLSVILDEMDIKARYPLPAFNYNNIDLLMERENRVAMNQLIEMLDDLVSLVPAVWKQLDTFKANLNP